MIPHDENLHKWVADYYRCRPADFVVLDGLQGVQNGPNPRPIERNQMNMRLIIAGKDAVATDTVAALIMGWDPQSVQHLVYLSRSGCGIMDPSKIDVLGSRRSLKFFVGGGTKTGGDPDKGTQSFDSEVGGVRRHPDLPGTSSGIVKVSARRCFAPPIWISPASQSISVSPGRTRCDRPCLQPLYSTDRSIPVRLM